MENKITGYLNPSIIEERKLNVAQMDVFSRLMMDRTIFIGEEITNELANIVIAQMLYLDSVNHEIINVYINSPGGFVSAGLAIYDTMEFILSPVHTVCIGQAASMGAIILLGGEVRKILKNSTIMMHQPSGGGFGTAKEIEITHEQIQMWKSKLYKIVEEKTEITNAEEIFKFDKWYTAKEALQVRFVTQIL